MLRTLVSRDRALSAENHPDPVLSPENEFLAPTFASAVLKFSEPDSSSGERADQMTPQATQQELPTKEYDPARPDNEPDRERYPTRDWETMLTKLARRCILRSVM